MKKVVRLTESDLTRLVRKVIKEQPIEDDRITTFGSTNIPMVILEGRTSKYVQKALRNLPPNVITIALKFCEGADFSEIDICEFPKLLYVLLKDTPNNFEEYVNCEYEKAGDDKYFFDN
jgi:hypothetical protein